MFTDLLAQHFVHTALLAGAMLLSILIALIATEGGILLSLQQPWPTSFFISTISFAAYLGARLSTIAA